MSGTDVDHLREANSLACQPQNASRIEQGRKSVAEMPRAWVLQNIEAIAHTVLELNDFWEYGRYLELLNHIGASSSNSAWARQQRRRCAGHGGNLGSANQTDTGVIDYLLFMNNSNVTVPHGPRHRLRRRDFGPHFAL